VTSHRQNQVRQLEDTWPMDGLCIYKYQLATQIEQLDSYELIPHESLTAPYPLRS